MAYNATILLGKITKVYGFEGTVTVKLEKTFIQNIPELESVFIETDGKPVPFFIADSDYPGGDILRLRFDGYNTSQKVNEFCGCRVFLTNIGSSGSVKEAASLISFKIFTADNKFIGIINRIIEYPGQWLLTILSPEGQEILVPYHEDLIRSVDKRKKIIIMDLPDGLIGLNSPPN